MGDDMGPVDQVPETQAVAFGTTVEELRSKMTEETPAPPAPASSARAEDFSEQSFLSADDGPRPASGSQGGEFLKNLFDEEER